MTLVDVMLLFMNHFSSSLHFHDIILYLFILGAVLALSLSLLWEDLGLE